MFVLLRSGTEKGKQKQIWGNVDTTGTDRYVWSESARASVVTVSILQVTYVPLGNLQAYIHYMQS